MSISNALFAVIIIALGIYFSTGEPKPASSPPFESKKQQQGKDSTKESKVPQSTVLDGLEDDDYYGIMGLKDDASLEEIRLAFRRLSRLHHPDKNLDDQECATRRFTKVNRAYETLSDRDSRSLYDFERRLKNSEAASPPHDASPRHDASSSRFWPFGSFENTSQEAHGLGHDCPGCVFRARWGISSAHLQLFTLPDLYSGLDDSPAGFFTLYRFVFDEFITQDECKFTNRDPSTFPSFGYSTWPHNVKSSKRNKKGKGRKLQKNDAKTFYDFWTTFSSRKDFSWAKLADTNEIPDSGMRRWLNKENKALEDIARNDYNDTVRDLAKYLRRQDPRCR